MVGVIYGISSHHISNLRWATKSQNGHNRGKQSNNTFGFKGVTYEKRPKKYRARIKISDKVKHLGYFTTAKEASKAYETKAKEIHGEYYYKNKK